MFENQFANRNLTTLTGEELERLKSMTDDELLRSAQTLDQFSVVESSRRLRKALHKEERAIKWLTVVLIILTLVLIVLGIIALRR
jgi:hypothetical protein